MSGQDQAVRLRQPRLDDDDHFAPAHLDAIVNDGMQAIFDFDTVDDLYRLLGNFDAHESPQ